MNSQDLAILRNIIRRTADVIENTRRLAALEEGADDPGLIIREIDALEQTVETFVDELAAREAASWGRREHPPRHAAPARIAGQRMPLSTEVEPHTRVERFGPDGRLPGAQRGDPPPLSGKWANSRKRSPEGR